MSAERFPAAERRVLLTAPGIGEIVVQRLEMAGFHSLQALREAGASVAAECVKRQVGSGAWLNRRRALERVIGGVVEQA
jgi:hypothetical protein